MVFMALVHDWTDPLPQASGQSADGNGREHVTEQTAHLMAKKQKREKRKALGPTVPFKGL
jgi:hypothetical protein